MPRGFAALSNTLIELAEEGHPVVACAADVKYSNQLVQFAERFPERFIQFGISEQNMVTAAAGLATTGLIPYVGTFASFLALLCCEEIRTDVAYCAQPVRLIGHHPGIALGFYGTSHHATEDLAIMRSIADLTVVAPAGGCCGTASGTLTRSSGRRHTCTGTIGSTPKASRAWRASFSPRDRSQRREPGETGWQNVRSPW